jgi:transposase
MCARVSALGQARRPQSRWLEGRRGPGRPRITRAIEQLIVRMASENQDWGYDRIVGALTNLGYVISDQTVGNILHRHGLSPAPERKRMITWPGFKVPVWLEDDARPDHVKGKLGKRRQVNLAGSSRPVSPVFRTGTEAATSPRCRPLIPGGRHHGGGLGGQPPPSMPAPSARKCGAPYQSERSAPSRYTPPHSHEIRSPTPRHGPIMVTPPSKIYCHELRQFQ